LYTLYKLVGAVLATSIVLLISGCTFTDQAIFPETGERTPLRDSIMCTIIGIDGDPGEEQFFNVAEVGSEEEGYQYYSFPIPSDGKSRSMPIIFSIHKTEVEDTYIGQAIADGGYHYFWYNVKSGMVSYMESDLMSADIVTLAEEHDVAVETKTRDYYQMVHGKDDDIKGFLLAYGNIFQGGGMKCVRE